MSLKEKLQTNTLFELLIGGVEYTFMLIISKSSRLYWYVAPIYYQLRASNDVDKYGNPPNVFKIESVDPKQIKRHSGRENKHQNRRIMYGKVMGGNWDQNGPLISNTRLYRSSIDHFKNKTPWEKTEVYKHRYEVFRNNRGLSNKEARGKLDEHFSEYDKLYEDIKHESYKPQQEIVNNPFKNNGLYLDTLDEVTVDVGRDGELLFVDGRHRLIIAKLLDINQIPVVFLVRHKEWMEYRDQVAEQDSIPDHPDLRDLK